MSQIVAKEKLEIENCELKEKLEHLETKYKTLNSEKNSLEEQIANLKQNCSIGFKQIKESDDEKNGFKIKAQLVENHRDDLLGEFIKFKQKFRDYEVNINHSYTHNYF